jgi:hypothetical protein
MLQAEQLARNADSVGAAVVGSGIDCLSRKGRGWLMAVGEFRRELPVPPEFTAKRRSAVTLRGTVIWVTMAFFALFSWHWPLDSR